MPFLVVPMLEVNDKCPIDVGHCGLLASKCKVLSLTFSPPGLVFQSPVSHRRPGGNQTLEEQQTSEARALFTKVFHLMQPLV